MATTTRMTITLLEESQADKEVTINEALNTIDSRVAVLNQSNAFTGNEGHFGATPVGAASADQDVISRLVALGFVVGPTYPLNTNGGDLTVDQIFASGTIKGSNTPTTFGQHTFSFPSDADYTLPAADAANKYLVINSGTLTATRNLILPTATGAEYCIVNNNGQSVIVKTAAGTGPTIASARTAWVRCGGANYLRTTADVAH